MAGGWRFSARNTVERAFGFALWVNRWPETVRLPRRNSMCSKWRSCPEARLYFQPRREVVTRDYLCQIESEAYDLSAWARSDILLSHQTGGGSPIANCKMETGIYGC